MRSLWVDSEAQHYPILESQLDTDVAIIGGGLSGMGAAWALRDSDLSVALLEARTLAVGASGRNAGFILAGPSMPYDEACAALGAGAACATWEFTTQNNRTIAALVEKHQIDCDYLRRGSMSLAASEEEWVRLQATHEALAAANIESCLVERVDLPRPFDRLYYGGIYYPGNAELNPACFVRAVGRIVSDSIAIYEGSPVRTLAFESDHWRLTVGDYALRAQSVILATNAYTMAQLPEIPIVPHRGQVLATGPLPSVVCPFPMYANHGYQYWRQTPGGRLVVGGWRDVDLAGEATCEESLNAAIQTKLDAFVEDFTGSEVPVEYRWAGIMGFTPDKLPLAGRLPEYENLYIAAGYSGHGVSMAFRCGQLVAGTVVGGEPPLPAFDPARFT